MRIITEKNSYFPISKTSSLPMQNFSPPHRPLVTLLRNLPTPFLQPLTALQKMHNAIMEQTLG